MEVEISERLKAIAAMVPSGSRIADIGSDHALLPVYLFQQNRIRFAVAGELNEGPYHAALRQVEAAGLQAHIHVRKADGLAALQPGEADTVIIAGMGGKLISRILTAGQANLNGVSQLILQPNVGEADVRAWLKSNGWFLYEERIIEEDGHIYEILVSRREQEAPDENDMLYRPRTLPCGLAVDQHDLLKFGPYLLQQADSTALLKKWQGEANKLHNIIKQMAKSDHDEAIQKSRAFQLELKKMEAMIACLQTGRQ